VLAAAGRLRTLEFNGEDRAGFCLMGACQDCWVRLGDGRRVRACTTRVSDGMAIETGAEHGA
jgi:predicted molibdopterin-dependent oxidoreductase YjgC